MKRIVFRELWRILWKQKGFLLLLVLLVLKMYVVTTDKPHDIKMEKIRSGYTQELAQYVGKLDSGKAESMEEWSEKMRVAKLHYEQTYAKFCRGKIDEQTFLNETEMDSAVLKDYKSFDYAFNQYIIARAQPEKSHIMYTNGWGYIMFRGDFGLLALFILVLLISPLFCEDYRCNTWDLVLSTSFGAKKLYHARCVVMLVLALSVFLIDKMIDLIATLVRFDLNGMNAPFQSLLDYSQSSFTLAFWQAYLLMLAISLGGYLIMAAFVIFLAMITKRYAITIVIATSLILLPFLLVSDVPIIVFYSLYGTVRAGDLIAHVANTGSKSLGLSKVGLLGYGLLVYAFAIVLLVCARLCKKNYLLRKRVINKKRKQKIKCKLLTVVISVLLVLNISSCGYITQEKSEETIKTPVWALKESKSLRYGKYIVYTKQIAPEEKKEKTDTDSKFVIRNIETSEENNLVSEPLCENAGGYYFSDNGCAYYFLTGDDYSHLYEYNLKSQNSRLMHRFESSFWPPNIFGLNRRNPVNENSSLMIVRDIMSRTHFVSEDKLYYKSEKGICTFDLASKKSEVLIEGEDDSSHPFNLCDGILYYGTSLNKVKTYNLKTKEESLLPNVITISFVASSQGLYYVNLQDQGRLYRYDLDTKAITKLTDIDQIESIEIDERNIYIKRLTNEDDSCYVMPLDGRPLSVIPNTNSSSRVECFWGYDKILVKTLIGNEWQEVWQDRP